MLDCRGKTLKKGGCVVGDVVRLNMSNEEDETNGSQKLFFDPPSDDTLLVVVSIGPYNLIFKR